MTSPRQRWARRIKTSLAHPAVTKLVFSPLRPLARVLPQRVLRRLPIVGVVTVDIPGTSASIRLHSDGKDSISNLVFWNGVEGWEPETVKTLAMLAPHCSTFLDIGANVGYHTLLVAALNPDITVHAFEPVSRIFKLLARNVQLNGFDNVVLHRRGLSNAPGGATIHVPRQHGMLPLQASLLAYPGHDDIDEEAVEVSTVDSVVDECGVPRVDLMKIDVEGAEHLVIAGAESTLRQDRPLVICEVLPDQPGVVQVEGAFRRQGYEFFALTASGLQNTPGLASDPTGKVLNYLCAPPDRLEGLVGHVPNIVAAPRMDEAGSRPRRRKIEGAASKTLT